MVTGKANAIDNMQSMPGRMKRQTTTVPWDTTEVTSEQVKPHGMIN